MDAKIVDASALSAVLFGEPEAESVAATLRNSRLFAPALLGFEVANVCLSKLRRHAGQRSTLLAAFATFAEIPIEIVDVDYADVLRVAEAAGLTVYDAAYLWLARRLGAELVTLDAALLLAVRRRDG